MRSCSFTRHSETATIITWAVSEIVRDINERPQLFLRLELSGVPFQPRAARAFMRVGEIVSRLVRFSPDFERAFGYFDRPLANGARIAFGYDHEVTFELHDCYARELTTRLDRARLPPNIAVYGESP